VSAETLRRAAALMRERAEAATPGPWIGEYSGHTGHVVMDAESTSALDHVASCSHYRAAFDSEHIASWHPTVALAVADLLDVIATWDWVADPEALAVARAYLGGQS
jgi:hypothetical protein